MSLEGEKFNNLIVFIINAIPFVFLLQFITMFIPKEKISIAKSLCDMNKENLQNRYVHFCKFNKCVSSDADCPPLSDVCSGGAAYEEDDSDGWDEMEINIEQTTCLFCPLQFHTIAVALDHCRSEHKFDLLDLKNKYNMDCYSYLKMVNYIRLQKPDPRILTESSVALWDDDVYLKPGDMETWLMYGR